MCSTEDIYTQYPSSSLQWLLPMAQAIQKSNGYLTMSDVYKLASHFDCSASEIYSKLTFYPQFRFKPKGKYHIEICSQSICRMKNVQERIKYIEKLIGIKIGETSSDLIFSFEAGLCKGICKPHIRINDKIYLVNGLSDIKDIIYLITKQK